MNKFLIASAFALVAAGTAAWAASPGDTIAARQANFKQMGGAIRGLNEDLRNPMPDLASIRAKADVVADSASKVGDFFPAGTGADSGVPTKALPAIWEQGAQFSEAANRLTATTGDLKAAAAGDDLEKIRAAAGAVAGACRTCHQTFRGQG